MNYRLVIFFIPIALISACIGTDRQDVVLVPARVEITEYPDTLGVNDNYQLVAEYFDSLGNPVAASFLWTSDNPGVLTVSNAGLVTGISNGKANIRVEVKDVFDEIEITVDAETVETSRVRTGTLQGRSGYDISGDFRIFEEDDTVYLEFMNAAIDDAPGPYYYLSNQLNSVTGGIGLGVAEDGNALFVLPQNVTVNTYDVVVVWCEPFSVTLGYGEFTN